MLTVLLLLLGFVILYYGANWLISGATSIATLLNLSKSFVGLTLVAFGTSAPELIVNLLAAARGDTDFALANVAGSNLTNLCLGFGIIFVMSTLSLKRQTFMTDLLFCLLAPSLVLIFFLAYPQPQVPYWSVAVFAGVVSYYIFSLKRRKNAAPSDVKLNISAYKATAQFIGGVVLLYLGGELVYRNALHLADQLGMSASLIGVTIVACGTSIPDVSASIIAAIRKENDIAVGNLLGSNISNILLVLGGTILASGKSLVAGNPVVGDYTAVCAITLLFVVATLGIQKSSRAVGVVLLVSFAAYYTFRIYSAL